MSTWALLQEQVLRQFEEQEKAIWPLQADSWNVPNSLRHHLVTIQSITVSGFLGGFCCSISSSWYVFNPGLNLHGIFVTIFLAQSPFLCSPSALRVLFTVVWQGDHSAFGMTDPFAKFKCPEDTWVPSHWPVRFQRYVSSAGRSSASYKMAPGLLFHAYKRGEWV